jgi:hypothetical protein
MKLINILEDVNSKWDAVLVAGLNYREDDKTTEEQLSLFKKGYGGNVKVFNYSDATSSVLSFMKQNPKIPIFLFSAGCKNSEDISMSEFVDVKKLYIIEPYAAGPKTKTSVQNAVSNGVPAKNVFVGPHVGRGLGVVAGASSTNAKSHWDALTIVGSKIRGGNAGNAIQTPRVKRSANFTVDDLNF